MLTAVEYLQHKTGDGGLEVGKTMATDLASRRLLRRVTAMFAVLVIRVTCVGS